MFDDANDDPLTLAQLTFARVSARAQECRNKSCARRRLCLAPLSNVTRPRSACPIMSEAEWRIVREGLRRQLKSARPVAYALDAAWGAEVNALPKKEREAAYAAHWAEMRTAPAREPPIWRWLWAGIVGDQWLVATARGAVKMNAWIIAQYPTAKAVKAGARNPSPNPSPQGGGGQRARP